MALIQVAIVGALIATMLCLPIAIALASLDALLGMPVDRALTFDGRFGPWAGLLLWWLFAFGAASVYAAFAFPWEERLLAWPRKK